MTCIVGLVKDGSVYIGGDSAGVSGYDVQIRTDPKVFAVGPYVIGYTSSFRMGQLLRYRLHVDEQDPRHDDFHHMATVFVDAVRDVLKTGGVAKIENSIESGGTFLVAYKGNLYKVEGDFQIGQTADGFDACGCGESYALGSLHATANTKLAPMDRVKAALSAAEHFSVGVRGPFVIESVIGDSAKDAA